MYIMQVLSIACFAGGGLGTQYEQETTLSVGPSCADLQSAWCGTAFT